MLYKISYPISLFVLLNASTFADAPNVNIHIDSAGNVCVLENGVCNYGASNPTHKKDDSRIKPKKRNSKTSQNWMNSFIKYSGAVSVPASNGFILKSAPSSNASTIKETNGYDDMDMAGHIDIDGQKFYMTTYSWQLYNNKGKRPNWVLLK